MSQSSAARFAPARAFGGAEYWRLWYAGLISFTVRWIETLAVAVFVFQHTHSPFLVAMMTMLRLLPMGLLGAFLGAWAERIERRHALVTVILLLLATDAALALSAFAGGLTIWQVAIGSFVNGIAWAADNPVRRAAIGEVVGSEHMGLAMSIDTGANNGTRMIGPTIGGLVLAGNGIQGVFALNAVLYATALVAALGLRSRTHHAVSSASVLAGIAEGLRFARQDARLVATLVVTIIYNLFAWPFTSMVPVIAETHLHLAAAPTGVLASMDGAGALLGAVIIAVGVRPRQYGRVYLGGIVLYTAMLIAFALMPTPLSAGATLLVEGLGGAGFSTMQATLIYLLAPPEMRSRMLGLLSVCIGVGPIGFLHLGLLANAIGAQWATVATGVEGLFALALTRRFWRVLLYPA